MARGEMSASKEERMRDLTNGFLVVKRFEWVYAAFAEKPEFDKAIYALPLCGTGPDRLTVRYRGLDREAISPAAKGSLAELRLYELKGATIDGTEDFLTTPGDALDVLAWANEEAPGLYEIVWARLVANEAPPPEGFVRLGFEPTYFTSDHFSAICDCMCFPRWHGTDAGGVLFREHFDRLNVNGLFDDAAHASEFLAHYLSFDWTEKGDYEIVSVWAPAV
jgi:hypothetical protein